MSVIVTLNGTIMSAARVPYALAQDGCLPAVFGRAHPRFHTPSAVLILQALMAIILVLFGGSFQSLFSLTIFVVFLFSMLNAIALFVFRFREPEANPTVPFSDLAAPAENVSR
jgi:basic amino acid/polyamine antiporter, APA family